MDALWKALAIISIIGLQLMVVYPYISGTVDATLSSIASSLGFPSDDVNSQSIDYSGDDSHSHEIFEYRMKVKMLRDRVSTMIDQGLIPPSLFDEANELIARLSDQAIDNMDYRELKLVEERLEYIIKSSGYYGEHDDDWYSSDIDMIRYKIYDKLEDIAEYRVKAEIYGYRDAIERLDYAESLLRDALNLLNNTSLDKDTVKDIYSKYFEAKMIIESVEHQIEEYYNE